jgi:hypothetical protein
MLILVITFVCLFSANQFVLTRALMVKPNLRLPLIAGNWKVSGSRSIGGMIGLTACAFDYSFMKSFY